MAGIRGCGIHIVHSTSIPGCPHEDLIVGDTFILPGGTSVYIITDQKDPSGNRINTSLSSGKSYTFGPGKHVTPVVVHAKVYRSKDYDDEERYYRVTKCSLPLAERTTAGCMLMFYKDILSKSSSFYC